MKIFLRHFYNGFIKYRYPLCCVWFYSIVNANADYPLAMYQGCWGNNDCKVGYVHCTKCANRIHGKQTRNMINVTERAVSAHYNLGFIIGGPIEE